MAVTVSLTWQVSVGGYRWEDSDGGRLLVPVAPPRSSSPRWEYLEPLAKHSALFRAFSDLSPTEDAILDFASRYGHLGVGGEPGGPGEASGMGAEAPREGIDIWAREIAWMKAVTGMWDAASSGDRDALSQRILFRAEPGVLSGTWYRTPSGEWPLRGRAAEFPVPGADEWAWAPRPAAGDPSDPAMLIVQDQINLVIRERCSVGLVRARRTDHPTLAIVPRDLLGAMWLQFAGAVSGDKRYRRCQVCGTWFELEPSTARTNRLFCSNACRVRAYRERRERAKQLSEEGYGAEAVAERLGTDVETARGWIESGR